MNFSATILYVGMSIFCSSAAAITVSYTHLNFTRRLQQHYPALNKEDLRYCCMVKMQLSQLEMSQIMHLEKDSVKKRLKRIRMEKMKADSGVTLEELLRRF